MRILTSVALIASAPFIASCATSMQPEIAPSSTVLPASIPADQLVGGWGLAAYHQEGARARTEAAARRQCNNPYKITKGPAGGVMMYLADSKELSEVKLKGGPDGKNYIGPDGPIGETDREIISFNGKVMVMRWLDPEVAGRYGTMVYVRCS